ncbi:MAG TPA: hypothetical protein EYH27_00500 [Anaerolineales bacterium]|nr:hypothetical protein [Anaerolineae bacterium]HIP86901.1 hypothetical protein [Anaerolineales bacterium]
MRGILLWGALVLWTLYGVLLAPSGDPPTADLRLLPTFVVARPGDTVRLEVWVESAEDLDRVEFVATYPEEVLEPLDSDGGRDGVQMEVGPVFLGGCIPENRAEEGTLRWVAWRAPEAGPFSGDGIVAVVTFRVREEAAPDTYPIVFDPGSVRLLDPDGQPLPVGDVEGGAVRVPPVTVGLRGWITREGTSYYGRTAVTVLFYPSAGSSPTTWARACTDEQGNFYLPVPTGTSPPPADVLLPAETPSGPYEWAYVRLDFPNHGSECYWEPLDEEVVDIGWHVLEGGDVNDDGCINIFDIVRIIADFGERVTAPCFVPFAPCAAADETGSIAPASDVNGDCRVNIFDLTITAENFGLCTNCP